MDMVEHKVVVENNEESFKVVPAPLRGIELGDLLLVTKYPKVREYTNCQKFSEGLRLVADEYVRDCFNEKSPMMFTVSDLGDAQKEIFKKNGYTGKFDEDETVEIHSDMLSFFDKKPAKKEEAVAEKKNYSIVQKSVDPEIIKEMIAQIDKERIYKTMCVAIGHGKPAKREVLDLFIEDWAKAKYDFYMAFGRKLKISTPIEFNMDESEMSPLIYGMYSKYPMYAASIDKIVDANGVGPFLENKCPECSFFSKYVGDIYKPGMKISKFFSQCFKNDQFDIDFSKVMQDRIIKGDVVVSIDPYDFITAATNMHGWSSCVAIFNIDHAAGSFAWVTDPNALIAYRDNGKEYTYDHIAARSVGGGKTTFDFGKNSFVGNSKSWRQIINVDKKNCAFLFGREYPQNKDIVIVAEKARSVVEEVIGKYLGITDWDNYGDLKDISSKTYFGTTLYKDVNEHHYSDIANWSGLLRSYPTLKKSLIAPTGTDMSKVLIEAGGVLRCFSCGRIISDGITSCKCGNC